MFSPSFQMSLSKEAHRVLQIWAGDSHIARHHHVPAQYKLVVNSNRPESQRYLSEPDLVNVRGGRKFQDERWWENFGKSIGDLDGVPRCFVICCGTNDLRRSNHFDQKEDILFWYDYLIDKIYKTSCATLLIISPIPDATGRTDDIGELLDRELRELCWRTGPRVRYVPFRSRKLSFKEGNSRWCRNLFQDEVHLNLEGSKLLAEAIFRQQTNFVNELYGFSSEAPAAAKRRRIQELGDNITNPRDLTLPRLSAFLQDTQEDARG